MRIEWDSYFILLYLQISIVNDTVFKETLQCRKHHITCTINVHHD